MTRGRRRKQDIHAARTASDTRYTRARREAASASKASIRSYRGQIYICCSCGQPAYESDSGPSHFAEQDGGVFCPAFPAASGLLRMNWDDYSLGSVAEAALRAPAPRAPIPRIHRVRCRMLPLRAARLRE